MGKIHDFFKNHLFSRVLILSYGFGRRRWRPREVVETTDGDHHHQGDEHHADDVFPSRKMASSARETLSRAARRVDLLSCTGGTSCRARGVLDVQTTGMSW